MCTSRVLLIALACSVAFVSCTVPEDAVLRESLVEELVQATPASEDKQLETVSNGGKTIPEGEAAAHDGAADSHDEVQCENEDEVVCNGVCQLAPCADVEAGEYNGQYEYTFRPSPTHLAAPPAVAGSSAEYDSEANNYLAGQVSAEQAAITAAEQSAGLGFASHDSALVEEAQRLAAMKLKVQKLMNIAASAAAEFKDATQAHNTALANVNKAQVEEKKQEDVVQEAKKTLAAEEDNLKKSKEHVTAMVRAEETARYNAEYKGQLYESKKADAIKHDNELQEQQHETEEKNKFRQVANAAVKKAAAQELEKLKQDAAQHQEETKNVGKNETSSCQDCSSLPAIYVEAGGSCSDCPKWAEKGECDQAEYKRFMHHYCTKSCGCPAAPADETQASMTMPVQG